MVLSGSCERVDEIRITQAVDGSMHQSAGTQVIAKAYRPQRDQFTVDAVGYLEDSYGAP